MAANVGYCGLDRLRQPLTGAEIRGCWESWPAGAGRSDAPLTIGPARGPDGARHREFVEVSGTAIAIAETDPTAQTVDPAPLPSPASEPGWNLWGDPDR